MVVILVFSVLLFNVAFADDDSTNRVAQQHPMITAQNFTLRATMKPSRVPIEYSYHYPSNEIIKPQFDSIIKKQNEESAICPSYNGLLVIIDNLLDIIKKDPLKADIVAQFREMLKKYSKPPLNPENHEFLFKKPADGDGQDIVLILSDSNDLRMANSNSMPEGGVKTKIVFKYELPNINLSNCKDVFLNLMRSAYETYNQLAKYPMCQKTPNIFGDTSEKHPIDTYSELHNAGVYQPINVKPKGSYEEIITPIETSNDQHNIISTIQALNEQNTLSTQIQDNPIKSDKKALLFTILRLIPDIKMRTMYNNLLNNMSPHDIEKIPDNVITNILLKYYPFGNELNPTVLMPNHQASNPANDYLIQTLLKFIAENKSPVNSPLNINDKLPQLLDHMPGSPNNVGNTQSIHHIQNPVNLASGVDINNLIINGMPNTQKKIDINSLLYKVPILRMLLPTYGNRPVSNEVITLLLKIPFLKEHILKLYGILPNPYIDLSNLELLKLLILNKIHTSGGKVPTLLELLGSRNLFYLKPDNAGVIELTYVVRKPQPVYFVKYQMPYFEFLTNVQSILRNKPHLKSQPNKIYEEIISMSNVSDMSPDLRIYPREEIHKQTLTNGELVDTKLLVNSNDNLKRKLIDIQNLNNNIGADEILNINNNNEMKYYNNYALYNNMDVTKTPTEIVQIPTGYSSLSYFGQQKPKNYLLSPMSLGNAGLHTVHTMTPSIMPDMAEYPQ